MTKKKKKNIKTNLKKKPVRKGRSVLLGRIAKITGVLAAVLILVYFSLSFALDKGFIKRDLKEKFGKVLGVTTLTLRIIGPPNKPILAAMPACENYVPHIDLYWSYDDQMDYFDLDRNGGPLVAGLTENSYRDEAVESLASYSYTVTAFNPQGQNTSDPVAIVMPDCGTPPPAPVLTATPVCKNYAPYVDLSWMADHPFDSYNLERDGNPLAGGLTETEYEDGFVEALENYSYAVTGVEAMGQITSEVVSATALDCPAQPPPPVLTATPVCKNDAPYIDLSWSSDDQMNSFDLEKNGNTLAGGLTETEYEDGSVEALATYSYAVTAFTSQGQHTSDTVSATALDCSVKPSPPPPVLPDPTCVITKFHHTNLSSFVGVPSTKERRPTFLGTTNMPGAEIDIVISGKTSVVAKTLANGNGFWLWSPPEKLNFGLNKIEATAIDPEDPARRKTASLNFKIKRPEEKDTETEKNESIAKNVPILTQEGESIPPPPESVSPPSQKQTGLANLSVKVMNVEKIAYPGRDLSVSTEIQIDDDVQSFDTDIKYWIVDEKYGEVFQTVDRIHVEGDKTIEKNLSVPSLLEPGRYKVIVSISQNGTAIVAEDPFLLKDIPLVNIGAGVTITAAQVMSNLFWVILWLLILLIIFLGLLEIEYRISGHAIIQITEEKLREKGLITRKRI